MQRLCIASTGLTTASTGLTIVNTGLATTGTGLTIASTGLTTTGTGLTTALVLHVEHKRTNVLWQWETLAALPGSLPGVSHSGSKGLGIRVCQTGREV